MFGSTRGCDDQDRAESGHARIALSPVSVKEGMPQWDLIGLEGVQNLPAVQWKLLNIGRMAPAKHSKALRKLRDYLNV